MRASPRSHSPKVAKLWAHPLSTVTSALSGGLGRRRVGVEPSLSALSLSLPNTGGGDDVIRNWRPVARPRRCKDSGLGGPSWAPGEFCSGGKILSQKLPGRSADGGS